jgi:probable rRNA maturation factor
VAIHITSEPELRERYTLDLRMLRSRAAGVLQGLGHSKSELSLALVDDAEIKVLNSEHRGKKKSTDVLSFSLVEGEHHEYRGKMLGDVVISVDTAARQARSAHRAFHDVITRLLIHGTLHLLGWDHEELEEARLMQAEERRLWRAIRS